MSETPKQRLERLRLKHGVMTSTPTIGGRRPELDEEKFIGGLRSFGQGVTLGHSDEITGYLRSLGSDRTYEDLRDEERAKLAKFRQEYPGVAFTTEIVGALLIPGFGVAGTLGKLGVKGAQNIAKTGGMGKLAAAGSAEGAVYGYGSSDKGDAMGQLTDAAMSAVPAAVLTPAMGAITKQAGRMMRRVSPEQVRAGQSIQETLDVSGDDIARYQRGGSEELSGTDVLGDVPSLQGLGVQSTGATAPGARFRTQQVLEPRLLQERGEVNEKIMRLMDTYDDDVDEVLSALEKELKRTSPERYRVAYEVTDIPTSNIFSGATRKEMSAFEVAAYAQARRDIDEAIKATRRNPKLGWTEADRLPKLSEFLGGGRDPLGGETRRTHTTRALHLVKQKMDDIAYGENGTRYQKDLTRQFNKVIEDVNPEYSTANQAHHIFLVQKGAAKKGKAFKRMTAPEIRDYLAKLPEEGKKAFGSGMLSAINAARQSQRGSLAAYVQQPKVREQIRAAFPDSRDFDEFMAEALRLTRQKKTHDWLFTGSASQPKLEQAAGADRVASMAGQAAMGGPGYAVLSGIGSTLKNRARLGNQKTLEEVNKLLFRHPGGPQKAIADFMRFASAEDRNICRGVSADYSNARPMHKGGTFIFVGTIAGQLQRASAVVHGNLC